MAEVKTCHNPACTCTLRDNQNYCSPHCENTKKDTVELVCECGHPGCGKDALKA